MTCELPDNFIASVERAEMRPGDILFIRLGIEHMWDDGPPWLPSEEETRYVADKIGAIVPEGVKVYVTHIGFHPQVVTPPTDDELTKVLGGTD